VNSAGNDIVALRAVDKQRTHYNRFYSKILSDTEHSFYRQQQPAEISFENFVWLLWSVKESVYKYLKRARPDLVFSPTKIIIDNIYSPQEGAADAFGSLSSVTPERIQWEHRDAGASGTFYEGVAVFGSQSFYFRSILCPEFISSIVHDTDNFDHVWWGIKRIGQSDRESQSVSVRAFVLDKLKAVLADGKGELRIEKSPLGHPVLLKGVEEMNIPISFAHHDHFITYSFLLARS
jgi:phosphopantetheinyl transferase (holo-ACP synthase)